MSEGGSGDAGAGGRDLYEDAALYDLQYRDYRDDLAFYRELALDHPGRVLELGAGTGRVTVELARVATEVVALEPAAAMRERAAARVAEAGVAERVTLLDGDARSYRPEGTFSLVAAPFHMLMHLFTLRDQDAALAAAAAALAPGGTFACDLFVPRFGPTGVVRRERTWRDAGGRNADLFLVQHHDAAAQRIESLYHLDETDAEGVVRRRRARLVQRYYGRFELERALLAAGFGRVRIFGDFDRRPVNADAPRYVVLARR